VEDMAESARPQVAGKNQRLATHLPEAPVWWPVIPRDFSRSCPTCLPTGSGTGVRADRCRSISHRALGTR
jgi:hypothetical protein